MTPARRKRLSLIALMLLGLGLATALLLNAFRENVLFFFSPTQIVGGEAPVGKQFRIGGMVVDGSVERSSSDLTVRFDLTDTAETVTVSYTGILPDLFREGQGIVAMGQLDQSGMFTASEVLAKHDENYMPPEVAEALEKAGKMPGTSSFGSDTVTYE
ncbi:MAG: cytochrome c maturation protein CcmE [Gammaproteobacteria bacterium]|nr:cytochrome c maturation protein CcmE [Gammaproteobacteria bacterium]